MPKIALDSDKASKITLNIYMDTLEAFRLCFCIDLNKNNRGINFNYN